MCENVLHFGGMRKDCTVTKVLQTAQYYTETKENAMNLARHPPGTIGRSLILQVLTVLLFPSIIRTRAGQLARICSHP